ncbi:MAG: secretion protein HlyD family protein, partial [Chloroflexi bacterium]|nr:secretion protein HlyD family protein [Chloroflexota bacterium]
MKKKALLICGLVVALLAASFFGYRAYASSKSSSSSVQTATVTTGSLAETLSSSGTARSGQSATISWETSGKVGTVTLNAGDNVTADQVLAELDTNTLTSEMIQAKQDLIDAKQTLDDLLNSKTAEAKALQAVEDAQKALDSLKVTAAEESSAAQLALAEAQAT